MQIYMQILIHGALVDQRDGRRRQGFLRLDPFRNVTELFGVFLNKILFLFQKNESKINRHGKSKLKHIESERPIEMCGWGRSGCE